MDDLLDVDIGKHDYDWLLTPPGTPRESKKLEHVEKKLVSTVPVTVPVSTIPNKRTPVRSSSTSRASRLSSSASQVTENGHNNTPTTRPVRSNSVTRSSYTPSSTNIRTGTNTNSILNTSTVSLSSSRPSTPTKKLSSLTRPSAPVVSSRTSSRSSTPVKSRPVPPVSKPATSSSRSSTPTRPRTATSSSGPRTGTGTVPSRTVSRSSTPTRTGTTNGTGTGTGTAPSRTGSRSSTPTRTSSIIRTQSSNINPTGLKRAPSLSGLNSAPTSRPSSPGQRPSSPGQRPRPPVRPLDIPDFPNETPPNLRTKLPDRPASAGRTRPGLSLTLRRETQHSQPSQQSQHDQGGQPVVRKVVPVVSRNKFSDGPVQKGLSSNGNLGKLVQKPVPVQKQGGGTGTGSDGFGRNISKKSLDMAIRHMDIRQNLGGIKGASLFPHSIRSNSNKPGQRPARASDPPAHSRSVSNVSNDRLSENGSLSDNSKSNGNNSPDRNILLLKETLNEMDLYGSSRYDAMLLKEDAKNTNWLHGNGIDDEGGDGMIFDHRFESLPEPF